MMCASSEYLKEAFIQGCKFLKPLGDFSKLRLIDDDHFPGIAYEILRAWLLQETQTAKIEVDAMFVFLITILRINSNQTIKPYQVNLVFNIPENVQKYEHNLSILPNFNQEENDIIFRNQDLSYSDEGF